MKSEGFRQERNPISSPELVEALIHAVSDVAIVTDAAGQITEVSCNIPELAELSDPDLIGRPIAETVTEDSRAKIDALIDAASAPLEAGRWREINHIFDRGARVPIRYRALRSGEHVVFLGREQRSVAALQSQLVTAQKALDQDYGRLRQMETRYRVLFQTSAEPLLIADAETSKVQEANAAAARMLSTDVHDITGKALSGLLHPADRADFEDALVRLRTTGGTISVLGKSVDGATRLEFRLTLFRAAESVMLLCRLRASGRPAEHETAIEQILVGMVGRMTEAVVVTDIDGRILWSNDAFLSMAEIALPEHIAGEPLARFFSRPGVDMDVILANARTHGRLRAFVSVLRGAFGSTTQVEISAANLPNETPPAIGFVLRDVSKQGDLASAMNGASSKSTDGLIELVGSVPLKELVRASTDEIERMCIETALKMTGNNRASAAEMLGLSRQSLYVKLRRFGLIDSDPGE